MLSSVTAWLAIVGPLVAILAALVKWWLGPKYTAWKNREAKDKAHKANDRKDGPALLRYFIRRRRK